MKAKNWFWSFLIIFILLLGTCAGIVAYVDPFFHYHAPNNNCYYKISKQRYQSDGVAKHFDYDGLITGTSITQNFKPSTLDEAWGTNSIKLPFAGATYKETADVIDAAFSTGHELKYVLRSLDRTSMLREKDELRTDLGVYPTYLYDSNPFNDVNYLLNVDVLVKWCIPVLQSCVEGKTGYTDFDDYDTFTDPLGAEYVLDGRDHFETNVPQLEFTEDDRAKLNDNLSQNVTRLLEEHPDTTFYLFIPGYSIAFWGDAQENGMMDKYLEAEKITIETLLQYDNVVLMGMNADEALISDLDNYSDLYHYSSDVNAEILDNFINGRNILTEDNYSEYLDEEWDYVHSFDYNSLFE